MTAARPTGTGAPGYTETWPCEPESARRARLLVSAALNAWGADELVDAGTCIVSELVANAVAHTPCRLVRVTIDRASNGVVRIGVADKYRATPELGRPGDGQEDGRGLLLVDAMSWRWGYDRKPWGKVVWAELREGGAA
ncbi:ATP-binding protein [Streptomyces sp. NPDC002221]|uniref:ATP-binding protein n=1 Tax=Streptomyces sp. NPDC002221 TaxID=3364639 RepID=UPI0036981D49